MTHTRALPAEPRHSRGGAGGVVRGQDEPSWYRQKVKIPKSVWGEGRYAPGAVALHAQITALHRRPERCRASVLRLAEWIGASKRSTERFLAELHAPGGRGGEPELTTIRHTDSSGDGETAERYTRTVGRDEHFAIVPVLAAKTLRFPLFVLYCALAHAVATGTPATLATLSGLLGVTEMTARRMVNELERLGWITVDRRAGAHGCHDYTVHDLPLRLVADAPEPLSSDGGSGACTDGGSLAIKEDAGLTDERSTEVRGSSAVGEVTVSGREGGREPVDNSPADSVTSVPAGVPVASVAATFRPAPRTPVRPAGRPPYDGPQLTLSPRVWDVLEPVADLLGTVRPFVARRIGREIGGLLDGGVPAEDIRDQLARMRGWTPAEDLKDPGRWLLGAVLPARSACGLPGCYWGFLTHTGWPCKTCAEVANARARAAHPPHTDWHECRACQAPSRHHLPAGLCQACKPA